MKKWLTTIIVAVLLMAGTANAHYGYYTLDNIWSDWWAQNVNNTGATIHYDGYADEVMTSVELDIIADSGEAGSCEVMAVTMFTVKWNADPGHPEETAPGGLVKFYIGDGRSESDVGGNYGGTTGGIVSDGGADTFGPEFYGHVDAYGYIWPESCHAEANEDSGGLPSWDDMYGSPVQAEGESYFWGRRECDYYEDDYIYADIDSGETYSYFVFTSFVEASVINTSGHYSDDAHADCESEQYFYLDEIIEY